MFIYFSNFARSLYSSYKNHSKVLHFIESYEGIIVYSFYLSIIMGDDNGSLDWERDIDDEYFTACMAYNILFDAKSQTIVIKGLFLYELSQDGEKYRIIDMFEHWHDRCYVDYCTFSVESIVYDSETRQWKHDRP